MELERGNPFMITKSVDFTDEEIMSYWVDLASEGGFVNLLKPTSPMPMFVLGGKGSGKTHVMRYMSFPVQKLRYGEELIERIRLDGYIGLYMRCGGLNSSRFKGKGQSEEIWRDVFAYQLEIWLAQIVVQVVRELVQHHPIERSLEDIIARSASELFDAEVELEEYSLEGIAKYLSDMQRQLNVAVNNVSLTKTLDLSIRATPGSLVFGLPRILADKVGILSKVSFLYLIDEFENLTDYQQVHINTLLRERQPPTSFRIGGRLYGVKTQLTNSGEEENKEDSEYELVILDDRLRKNEAQYSQFAKRLIMKRLVESGVVAAPLTDDKQIDAFLTKSMSQFACNGLMLEETKFVIEKYAGRDTPWIKRLRDALKTSIGRPGCIAITSENQIDAIAKALSFPSTPILEKLNCLIFYQNAKSKKKGYDSLALAEKIRHECQSFAESGDRKSSYGTSFQHYRLDMLAQLLRESDRDMIYAGAETFVNISWGIPRNLLVLFKNVFEWAVFKGERPFTAMPISLAAQNAGVREAANWFFRDSRMTGSDGRLVLDSMHRLGELFREIQYSDKPSECELTTFSFDSSQASEEATRIIQLAINYSLLIEVSKQSDRNSQRIDRKLQISRMIAPRWELGINSRGAISLSSKEIDAIFTGLGQTAFASVLKDRVSRMTAPCFGTVNESMDQQTLFKGLLDG